MQVKLITTVESIIEVDPAIDPTFEESKREIFGRLEERIEDEDDIAGDIQSAHSASVVFDKIIAQTVTHSFEEVK